MTGHVRNLRGYWRILLELEPVDGRRRQEMLPEKYTAKKAAEKAMHDALRDRERGDYVAPVDLSLSDYLQARWLPALGAENLSPNTLHAYKLHVKRISAHIGTIPLQKLTRNDVSVMAAKLASETSVRGSILSPASRRAVLVVLHHALGDAVKAGLLRTNPAHGVTRPKVRMPELNTWSRDELATFLRATKDDRLSPLWRLLAMTGLRRGEALGLRWADVDLASGRLAIQRQRVTTNYEVMERPTKTDRGRSVAIDAATVSALQRQRDQQLEDAVEWADAWTATGHVFTREDGEPWHPDRITDLFRQAVKAAGVPSIRLHDLRHGWATHGARRRHPSQGRAGAARAREHRHDDGPLQSRHPGAAGVGGGARGGARGRGAHVAASG